MDSNINTANRFQSKDKIEVEMKNLEILNDNLSKSETMTSNMLTLLETFENRLKRLEETITPVYNETGNLQRRHENIEKTLNTLDFVIGYYHIADEVEPVVRDGPASGIQHYVSCMSSLQKAMSYFNKNNPDSPELSHVTTLYEAGKDALEREFRNILTRHSKPVQASLILDILSTDEPEASSDEIDTSIEHLKPHVIKDLSDISQWLTDCDISTDHAQVYGVIRSDLLSRSLQGLRDHLKTGSRDSNNLLLNSPAMVASKMKPRKDTPSRLTSKRMEFVRKASSTLMKHSKTHLEPVTMGLRRQGSNASDLKDEGADVDIDFYITSISAFLQLIQGESTLMQGIIPEKFHRKVFEEVIRSSLDKIVAEGELLASNSKKAASRYGNSALLSLFPVLKHLRSVKSDINTCLEGCQISTKSKLPKLIMTLDNAGAKALINFKDNLKTNSDKSSHLPKDGTVHELTSNTVIFLQQLLEFSETAGAMLLSQDPGSLSDARASEKTQLKLGEYMTQVLSNLGLNLNNKAETYSDATIQSIFLLNNFNYILKSLKRSGLLELINHWNPNVESYYDDQVLEQKAQYSQSWSRVVHYIGDSSKLPISSDTKMKDKDRQLIKDRFSGFNKEIEEIHKVQKVYAIPDAQLRETLRKDNKEYIIPMYQSFCDRYIHTNFTKNLEKYIKYTKSDVIHFIDQLFDSAA